MVWAKTQLMLAVIGVLNESFTESLRGFYRLRQAFNTLYEIMEAEKKYMKNHFSESRTSLSSSSPGGKSSEPSSGSLTPAQGDANAVGEGGLPKRLDDLNLNGDGTKPATTSRGQNEAFGEDLDFRSVTDDPVSFLSLASFDAHECDQVKPTLLC